MEARQQPLKVVESNLKKQAASNADKTIADVLLDGTYSQHDIYSILNSGAFPTNAMGGTSPDERRYDSNEAIEDFARAITPFLSDIELHRLTSMAVQVECSNDTSAFRNSSLAKALLKIQVERLKGNLQSSDLLDAIKCHFKEHILGTIKQYWGGNLIGNINKFLSFNLGYPEVKGETYLRQISDFDDRQFNQQLNSHLPGAAPCNERERKAFVQQYSKNPKMHLPPVQDVNYHPQLLSPYEAKANTELLYSDHLPIAVDLLIDQQHMLKVVSWNIWDPGQANGFKTPNEPTTRESIGDQTARYERIADTIIRMLTSADEKVKADVILLQEVNPDCLAILQRKLANTPFAMVLSETGKVTIYNQEMLKLDSHNEDFRACCLTSVFKISDSTVRIDNMHLNFDPLPVYAEETLLKLKEKRNPQIKNHLIMGDLNSCVKPLDKEARLIVTGLCPSTFRRDNNGHEICQGVDWTDGAFRLTRADTLTQVEHRMIDPATCTYIPTIAAPFLPDFNDAQRKELSEARMAICVSSPYNDDRVFAGKTKTITEYETILRNALGDNNLLVRIGSNACNEEAICILSSNAKFINDLFSYLTGTRATIKNIVGDMGNQFLLSIGRQWLPNLECALFASLNLVEDKLINALRNIKGTAVIGIFERDPTVKLAKTLSDMSINNNTPAVTNLLIAAIMSSDNEKLKKVISTEFDINKNRDVETAFTMMLKSPFDEFKKNQITQAINANNPDSIEAIFKSWREEIRQAETLGVK